MGTRSRKRKSPIKSTPAAHFALRTPQIPPAATFDSFLHEDVLHSVFPFLSLSDRLRLRICSTSWQLRVKSAPWSHFILREERPYDITSAAELRKLFRVFDNYTLLETVDFNGVESGDLQVLSDLGPFPSLRSLRLCQQITQFAPLAKLLSLCPSLRLLKLGRCIQNQPQSLELLHDLARLHPELQTDVRICSHEKTFRGMPRPITLPFHHASIDSRHCDQCGGCDLSSGPLEHDRANSLGSVLISICGWPGCGEKACILTNRCGGKKCLSCKLLFCALHKKGGQSCGVRGCFRRWQCRTCAKTNPYYDCDICGVPCCVNCRSSRQREVALEIDGYRPNKCTPCVTEEYLDDYCDSDYEP
eukprot:gb/GEZN01010062.1/.p1 GENE.gb/GEZN01010062.1/~~gb/GEZN01010062.1/.p1  ORF type:complete len:360 (+),score=16.17 gb/GEZN01010062.1/:129-1208(+)